MQNQLVVYDAMRRAIAAAASVDEVKDIRDKAEALRVYAKQAGETLEDQNRLAEIKIRAERRAGELLKETVGHSGGSPSHHVRDLPDGVSPKQSSRWQAEASVPEERFAQYVQETVGQGDELTSAGLRRIAQGGHVRHNSGEVEWYTPSYIVEAARAVLGAIDCDPASSDIANQTIKAAQYYTVDNNGLTQQWGKRVWMNPPYSQPLVVEFCKAFLDRLESGEITAGCVLVNNATETAWFQGLADAAVAICLLRGRVKFLDTSGKAIGAPLQGQIVLYYGSDRAAFSKAFAELGSVWAHG